MGSTPLPIQDEFREHSHATIHSAELAGLAVTTRFYVREETLENWRALEQGLADKTNLWVSGPPGTGKSSTAWAWVLWKARTTRKKAVWFHFTGGCQRTCIIDGATEQMTTFKSDSPLDDIPNHSGDILIVDGVVEANQASIFNNCDTWRVQNPEGWFALVSSASATMAYEHLAFASVRTHSVASWVFEDYLAACADDEFFTSVETKLICETGEAKTAAAGGFGKFVEEHKHTLPETLAEQKKCYKMTLLKAKYFYAGGCARWMFGFPFWEACRDINNHVEKAEDYHHSAYQQKKKTGDRHSQSVNYIRGLMKTEEGEDIFFPISQYVLSMKAQKVGNVADFLREAYTEAKRNKNAAFRIGWCFEFDVDYQLQTACSARSKIELDLDGAPLSVLVSNYITYDKSEQLEKLTNIARELKDGESVWAKPMNWRETGYDFLWFSKSGDSIHLHTIKMLHGHQSHHDVLLLYSVDSLIRKLETRHVKIERVGFSFLTPSDAEQPRFFFTEATTIYGSLKRYVGLNGERWDAVTDLVASIGHMTIRPSHPCKF